MGEISRGGHPDPNSDLSKSRVGHPDPNPDPSRPDFCRDFIPLEISRPWLLQITSVELTLKKLGPVMTLQLYKFENF